MTTTTPDMTLVLPDVSITAGPQWAALLNAAFTRIDAHDHSTTNGVKITPSGLNISSDLTFAQNNATDLRTLRLYNYNSLTPATADKTCLFSKLGELYYVDGSGNIVQLTINGTVDVANSITALSIKDSGFFVQYFGDITRQFRFNVSAIPASTTRILSVPDSGSNDTFVTQAATQTLTNKTITSPTISTPSILTSTNITAVAAPIAPASGTANVYVSSVDGQLHLQNSAGVDTAIGAGSSSGKNYLQSYYGFSLSPLAGAATSLTSTGNRTSTQTFFGTSTASAATLITYNTATPLRAPGDLQITFPIASSGAFVESPMFTLDSIDVNAGAQFISFESNFPTSGAVSGDITVVVVQYDSSGNYVGVVTPSITNVPTGYYKFRAAFNPSTTATAKYSLRFIVNTASARTIDIQDIVVGPQFATTTDAIGGWIPYTPTFSTGAGTVSGVAFFYRRIGDSAQIKGIYTSGTVAASPVTFTLPTGLNIDTGKINTTALKQSFGMWVYLNQGGDFVQGGGMGAFVYDGSSTTTMQQVRSTASGSYGNTLGTNLGSSSTYEVQVLTVPISQWTSSVTLAGNANIEYVYNSNTADAADTTSFGYGATGVAFGSFTAGLSKRVQFQTPVQPTDRIQIEIMTDSVWVPLAGGVRGSSSGVIIQGYQTQNTNAYGMYVRGVSGSLSQLDITFGTYSYVSGTTFGATGGAWSGVTSAKWRVAKYSAVGLAELAPATATSQGSISRESSWTAFTPTISGLGTVTSISAFYRVVGDSLFVKANYTIGTVAGTQATFTLPTGFTISSSKIPNPASTTASTNSPVIGNYASANANNYGCMLACPASSTSLVYYSANITSSGAMSAQLGTGVTASGVAQSINFEVPLV